MSPLPSTAVYVPGRRGRHTNGKGVYFGLKYSTVCALYGTNGTRVKIRYCTVNYGTVGRPVKLCFLSQTSFVLPTSNYFFYRVLRKGDGVLVKD